MAAVDVIVRIRQVAEDLTAVASALNREILRVLPKLHTEVNRLGGDVITVTDSYTAARRDGVIICNFASTLDVFLPDPADVPEKRVTVVRIGARVDISDSAGGTISGSSTISIGTAYGARAFISDGSAWWLIGDG